MLGADVSAPVMVSFLLLRVLQTTPLLSVTTSLDMLNIGMLQKMAA